MSGLPSRVPYVFEPGMSVRVIGHANPVLVTMVDNRDHGMWTSFQDARLYVSIRDCTADLDHPGTRGLLLQQYRDASGNPDAVAIRDDGSDWIVDRDPASTYSPVVGRGESEGAAILDALTRLAAERARESEPSDMVERVRRIEAMFSRRLDSIEQRLAPEHARSVEGSEAILRALLTETQAAMAKLSERLDALEGKVWR